MSNTRPQHVIVIGGGLAGLAAAEALTNAEHEAPADRRVTLIEPAGRPGGVIATERRDGWLIERSADSFLAARPEAVDLVDRVGLSGELIGIDPRVRRALVYHRGRMRPVPAGFRLLAPGRLRSILTTPMLTPLGRLRLIGERFVPPRDESVTDESLEHFAVRRLGREVFERLVQPLAAGIWTADPARLSMAAACPEFFAMERVAGSLWAGEQRRCRSAAETTAASGARYGQFLTLANGLDTLPLRLAGLLEARGVQFIAAAATGLQRRPGRGWEVRLRGAAASDSSSPSGTDAAAAPFSPATIEADAVIVAVPAPRAAALLRQVAPALAVALEAIEYAGSSIVSLGFAREDVAHPLDAAGVVVPRAEQRRILAVSFSSQKFPARAPSGAVLLRTFVGGALDPETADLDDDRLVPLVLEELRHVLGVRGRPRVVQVDRWRNAMPQYTVGHVDRVATIQRLVAEQGGLAVAGAAYEGVGIPQVIAAGRIAAAQVS